MDAFNFAFSLFGLVLGLSVTEVVSGFARVLRDREKVRLGWLTPTLALLLLVDLVTFWTNAWSMRAGIDLGFVPLLVGTMIASVYYLSASLVFPQELADWPDLDDYFIRHKGQVVLGVMVANTGVKIAKYYWIGPAPRFPQGYLIDLGFAALFTLLIITRRKDLSVALLGILLTIYAITAAI